jgi:RimJ/RimL family protein N-acetyltransferase
VKELRVLGSGRHVQIRVPEVADVSAIHRIVTDPQVRHTWRSRGDFWTREMVERRLGDADVLAVASELTASPLFALLELHDLDLMDGRGQVAVAAAPSAWSSGRAVEATILFVEHVFASLPLAKLVFTVQAENGRAVAGLRRVEYEGTLHRHLNVHGTWQDVDVFALWRERFAPIRAALFDELGPAGSSVVDAWADLRRTIEELLLRAGHRSDALEALCFGDIDSLLTLQLVTVVEDWRGEHIAMEALALDQPIVDLLHLAGQPPG